LGTVTCRNPPRSPIAPHRATRPHLGARSCDRRRKVPAASSFSTSVDHVTSLFATPSRIANRTAPSAGNATCPRIGWRPPSERRPSGADRASQVLVCSVSRPWVGDEPRRRDHPVNRPVDQVGESGGPAGGATPPPDVGPDIAERPGLPRCRKPTALPPTDSVPFRKERPR